LIGWQTIKDRFSFPLLVLLSSEQARPLSLTPLMRNASRSRWGAAEAWCSPSDVGRYFWLTTFTYEMIGTNELTARLWPAIFGFGVVVLTFFLRVRFRSWTVGATAVLLLLVVDYGYYGYWWNFLSFSRVGMLDTLLTFSIMVALVLVWETERRPWLIALLILVAKSHRSLPTRLRRKRGERCLCHERWAAEPYGTSLAAGPPSDEIRPPTPPACR
jgi:hypothetical protein